MEPRLSRNLADANAYLRDLRKRRDGYRDFVQTHVVPAFREEGRERRPPREFVDSSFLFIRSDATDQGVRPRANGVFWLSPDLRVSPLSTPGAYTETLTVGTTYDLACTVRNRGDLGVPAAKVEFYLTDPTLGFDTRFATHLTLGRVASTWVNSMASGTVHVPWTATAGDAGHKCLIARTFSFSPLDLPLHDTVLDPTLDRHVAQLNLNIVGQGQAFAFDWVHWPTTRERLVLTGLDTEALLRLGHPALAERRAVALREGGALLRRSELRVAEAGARLDLAIEGDAAWLDSRGAGPDPDEQARFRRGLAAIVSGGLPADRTRALLQEYRRATRAIVRSRFEMRVPDLGLGAGDAAALHVMVEGRDGEVRGGLTLLVLG